MMVNLNFISSIFNIQKWQSIIYALIVQFKAATYYFDRFGWLVWQVSISFMQTPVNNINHLKQMYLIILFIFFI